VFIVAQKSDIYRGVVAAVPLTACNALVPPSPSLLISTVHDCCTLYDPLTKFVLTVPVWYDDSTAKGAGALSPSPAPLHDGVPLPLPPPP